MEFLKLISASELVAQITGFLLLLFLLRRFLWKRVLGVLDARREKIAAEYRQIEDTKAGTARLQAEYERQLDRIEEAAERKIQEAVAAGRLMTDELRKKANEEAQSIIDKAREHVRYELAKAKESLKEEIIDVAIKAAESVIQEKLTEEDDRRIVGDFIKRLDRT